jgi:endogenous inhibitor of DNA gyrase (YacG/DUF329 family)
VRALKHPLSVACPTCRGEVEWSNTSPWRPFCSARCKGIDLGDWASNRFVIAANDLTDRAGDAAAPAVDLSQ